MHGLEQIKRMNAVDAAKFMLKRYQKLRKRAILRGDFVRAKRYDGQAEDLHRFITGEILVWPNQENRKAGLYQPSEGRDFREK